MSLFDACRTSTRSSTGSALRRSEKGTSSATQAWWTWRLGLSRRIWRSASLSSRHALRVLNFLMHRMFLFQSSRYPVTHPFATALGGSDNIIMFHTARYGARPLVVQGAGAGAAVTAMGVMSDLLKLV